MASELADQARKRKGGPRRLIMLAAIVVGVAALVVVLIAVQRRPPPIPEADPTPPKPQISRVDIERIVAVSLTGPGTRAAVQHAAHRVRLGGRRGEQRDSDQGVTHQGHTVQLRQPVRGTGHRRGSRRPGPVRAGSARGGGGGHAGRRLHDRGVPRRPHSRGQHLVPGSAGEAHRLLGVDQSRQSLLLHGGRPARRRVAHDQRRGARLPAAAGPRRAHDRGGRDQSGGRAFRQPAYPAGRGAALRKLPAPSTPRSSPRCSPWWCNRASTAS